MPHGLESHPLWDRKSSHLDPKRVVSRPKDYDYEEVYYVPGSGALATWVPGDIWVYKSQGSSGQHSALLIKDQHDNWKLLSKDKRNAVFVHDPPGVTKIGHFEGSYAASFGVGRSGYQSGIQVFRELEEIELTSGFSGFRENDPYEILSFNFAKVYHEPNSDDWSVPTSMIQAYYSPDSAGLGYTVSEFRVAHFSDMQGVGYAWREGSARWDHFCKTSPCIREDVVTWITWIDKSNGVGFFVLKYKEFFYAQAKVELQGGTQLKLADILGELRQRVKDLIDLRYR